MGHLSLAFCTLHVLGLFLFNSTLVGLSSARSVLGGLFVCLSQSFTKPEVHHLSQVC